MSETAERTKDVVLANVMPFTKMILDEGIRKGLQQANYIYPTLLQAAAIPLGRSGKDLLIQAKSGTGKTLIFACIILEKYCPDINEGPQSIIIVPTRELAIQISDILNVVGRYKKDFLAVVVIGGLSIIDDRNRIQKAKCVIGTPGRLYHLIKNGILNTNNMTLLIIDEADKLYTERGHDDTLKYITGNLSEKRQTIICSATFENNFDHTLAKMMHKPLLVTNKDSSKVLIGVKQFILELPETKNSYLEIQNKLMATLRIFQMVTFKQCIIFASTQLRADSYHTYLTKLGWKCDVISGKHDQNTRMMKFSDFRKKVTSVLVTTDLMSRGIDSDEVNLVVNLDLPCDATTYLHRIGRAGRFGTHGIAISCASSLSDYQFLNNLKISESGSDCLLLKFPSETDNVKRNLWDFSNIQDDIDYYGIFEADKKIFEQPSQVSSIIEDKIEENASNNLREDINNGNTSIKNDNNSDTFIIKFKEHDKNLEFRNELIVPIQQPTPSGSPNSSTQYLATSDTIDDASSIAADSLDSYQQLRRHQSIHKQTSAIPKILSDLNVIDVSSNEITNSKANLKLLQSQPKDGTVVPTDVMDQLFSLVIDKPANELNNVPVDPFQDYGMHCDDENQVVKNGDADMDVVNNEKICLEKTINSTPASSATTCLYPDELDSDVSVTTVATQSAKCKHKTFTSMKEDLTHFMAPNYELISKSIAEHWRKSEFNHSLIHNSVSQTSSNCTNCNDYSGNGDANSNMSPSKGSSKGCKNKSNESIDTTDVEENNINYIEDSADEIRIHTSVNEEIFRCEYDESTSFAEESNNENENSADLPDEDKLGQSEISSDDKYNTIYKNSQQQIFSSVNSFLRTLPSANGNVHNNYEDIYLNQMEFIENYSDFYCRMWMKSFNMNDDTNDYADIDDDDN